MGGNAPIVMQPPPSNSADSANSGASALGPDQVVITDQPNETTGLNNGGGATLYGVDG